MASSFFENDGRFEPLSKDEQNVVDRVNARLRVHRASVAGFRETKGDRDAQVTMYTLEPECGPLRGDPLESPYPFTDVDDVVRQVLAWIDKRRPHKEETKQDAADEEFYKEISALDEPDDWSGV